MRGKKCIAMLLLLCMVVLLVCGCSAKPKAPAAEITSLDDLAGKKIAMITGTIFDTIVPDFVSNPQFEYYNSFTDVAVALETGKADAYVMDEPASVLMCQEYPSHRILQKITEEAYAFVFDRSEKSAKLCAQMNEFLAQIKADGTMDELRDIWLGNDPEKQVVDFSGLTAENGTLSFGTATSVGAPFTYVKDGAYCGYDIDMAARFCRAYGYGLDIEDMNAAGLLAALPTGKVDFGAASIAVTEERKQGGYVFSDPNFDGGIVIVVKSNAQSAPAAPAITSLDDLAGRKIGILSGTIFDQVAADYISNPEFQYYQTFADNAMALDNGKTDAYLIDEPMMRLLLKEHPSQHMLTMLEEDRYGFIFPKTEEGAKLRDQFNQFLAKARADGLLDQLDAIWFGEDEAAKTVDYDSLTGENGTLNFATDSTSPPFTYSKGGVVVGYEADLAARFCKEYGYDMTVSNSAFDGVLASVTSGKSDFAASCISITEERQESMYFSEPDYVGGIVVVVKTAAETASSGGILESLEKTFIREGRWKLFASGIGVTLLITVVSVIVGTIVGFLLYLLYRRRFRVFNGILNVIMDIFEKTPVVVILMILYYIVFGTSNLDGMWVAVVGFSLLFAFGFIHAIDVGVKAIDIGQSEASLALGFANTKSFMNVILPQAAKHFLPHYRGNIVSLLKDTAIVGYIAVEDLTKVGDIIRSRTYEAFFPLIVTAVIYFLLAWLLTLIVRRIEFRFDPKNRSEKAILRGVKTK